MEINQAHSKQNGKENVDKHEMKSELNNYSPTKFRIILAKSMMVYSSGLPILTGRL